MKKALLLTFALLAILKLSSQFDDQMKAQRRAFFAAIPITSNDIVFIGNSITNGGEWHEFFPEQSIKDRGISGDRTTDVLTRLHPIVIGQPQKVFIKIGTNDGPSETNNQTIANRIGQMIDTFKIKSPSTEIYVQTVFPRSGNNSIRDLNAKIDIICKAKGVSLLNVYSQVKNADSTNLNSNYTNDNLHLLGTGYSKWAHFLKPFVGATELGIEAAESVTQISGLNHNYCNQRATEFELLKGKSTDVLFIGDDVIDCVEWSEMFQNKNVKGRGIGVTWGTSVWIDQLSNILQTKIFKPYTTVKPAKVFIYAGANDIVKNAKNAAFVRTHTQAMINYIRQQSPTTEIYIQGYLPHSDEAESEKLITANTQLKELTQSYPSGVTYIDLFAAFKKSTTNTINAKYTISANALNAKGFLHWANTVYSYIDDAIIPIPEPADLTTTMPANGPKVSSESQNYWYYIKGQRGAGGENYITANTDNSISQKAYSQSGYQHWRIINNEGGFVLQNRITQKFINTAGSGELSVVAAMPDKSLQFRPSQDPNLSAADLLNYFCLENIGANNSSASFRLHAGGSGNTFKLMNWTGGANDNSSWTFITANEGDSQEPELEINPLPVPLVHLTNITLNGMKPYRLSNEDFNKIKELEEGTIVMTIRTTSSAPIGNQFIFAAVDTTVAFNYAGVAISGTTARIQMAPINSAEGWYSGSGTTPSFASDLRIIYRATKSSLTLDMAVNQTFNKVFPVGSGTNPAYRFIKNFSGANATNAVYLGGIVTTDSKNKYPLSGTIKNMSIFNTPLNATQVAYLHNHWEGVTTSLIQKSTTLKMKIVHIASTIHTLLPEGKTATKATIFNLHGQAIHSTEIDRSEQFDIDLSQFKKGIYLLKVLTSEGNFLSQTFIIQ